MSNDAHHWKLCPDSTEYWGNSDLVTSPSLGILCVRLFPSCSSWLTFDANTLFFSHKLSMHCVLVWPCCFPQSLGPDLFGPMAFWVIVQFVGIYHQPKRFRILKLLCCHGVIFLCIWDWWIYPHGCVYTFCSVCIHPYILLCVCACLLLPLPCAGESEAEGDDSQAGHEGPFQRLTESTTERSQRHDR